MVAAPGRAHDLGGTLEVGSGPDGGTVLIWTVLIWTVLIWTVLIWEVPPAG